ncbi:MAG TPA: sigma factor-like helix-turn-helix DNA-binding protein [Solirubrobacteraceae bacterium]|nr:sigma factor-like helix-turn-helix DNA-binding protein [Solirubrobacteraceae bacterium]
MLALRIGDELTQKEIADRIGVSQMQVSRMLRRIENELRQRIEPEPDRSPHPTARHFAEVNSHRVARAVAL